MTSAQTIIVAAVAVATPTLTALIGIILQRQDARDIRAELRGTADTIRAEMRSGFSEIRADMIALRKEVHADLLLIHERVAVVESKQQ